MFGRSCTLQSTPMKGVETGVCQNKNGGTRTLVDKTKKMFSDLPKSML